MNFYFGYISEVDDQKGLYKVNLEELGIVTDWMSSLYMETKGAKDENTYDINQHVGLILKDNKSTGVIMGAVYDNVTGPVVKDKNKRATTYADGSSEIFDKSSGNYTAHYKGIARFEGDDLTQIYGSSGIELGGNSNQGILKVIQTVGKINIIENDINMLKSFVAAWVVVPADGGAALKALLTAWAATLITNTTTGNLENTNVKH